MKINPALMTVASPHFAHGEPMPADVGNRGAGISPELAWANVPDGTASFAVVAQDADAPIVGGFWHWVVYGIPGTARGLPAGGGSEYVQGINGLGGSGWVPAAPTPGHGAHFYHFHVFALRTDSSELPPGFTALELFERIEEDVLDQGRVVGTYDNDG